VTYGAGSNQQMDVVFILAITPSIPELYENAVLFITNVTNGLDIDSGNVRVGAIACLTSPHGRFYLRDYNRRQAVLDALRFYNPGANINTASALDEVLASHFTGASGSRSGAKKVKKLSPSKFCFFSGCGVLICTRPNSLCSECFCLSRRINMFTVCNFTKCSFRVNVVHKCANIQADGQTDSTRCSKTFCRKCRHH